MVLRKITAPITCQSSLTPTTSVESFDGEPQKLWQLPLSESTFHRAPLAFQDICAELEIASHNCAHCEVTVNQMFSVIAHDFKEGEELCQPLQRFPRIKGQPMSVADVIRNDNIDCLLRDLVATWFLLQLSGVLSSKVQLPPPHEAHCYREASLFFDLQTLSTQVTRIAMYMESRGTDNCSTEARSFIQRLRMKQCRDVNTDDVENEWKRLWNRSQSSTLHHDILPINQWSPGQIVLCNKEAEFLIIFNGTLCGQFFNDSFNAHIRNHVAGSMSTLWPIQIIVCAFQNSTAVKQAAETLGLSRLITIMRDLDIHRLGLLPLERQPIMKAELFMLIMLRRVQCEKMSCIYTMHTIPVSGTFPLDGPQVPVPGKLVKAEVLTKESRLRLKVHYRSKISGDLLENDHEAENFVEFNGDLWLQGRFGMPAGGMLEIPEEVNLTPFRE